MFNWHATFNIHVFFLLIFFLFFSDKVVELVIGGFVINGATLSSFFKFKKKILNILVAQQFSQYFLNEYIPHEYSNISPTLG